ncbi:uncharacterized protein LOC106159497 [Lingula anatina]|uniref:Uncharacterized protein LOC106159497 n=1 Tax=Lingula anatina TaxID=7574 RepID=A0A1S3I1M3_LINAN|nr:uncharacterized protein LOC106159497 [Lingula anatina]|eukprot:XP_013391249.1 uncharacterized protein LOC106159497 [Lingula anatina]
MDTCGVLCSITAILIILTPHATSSFTNNTNTSAPSIGNGSVSQRHNSDNATESAPAATRSAPNSILNKPDTANNNNNNNNVGIASQRRVTSTCTATTPTTVQSTPLPVGFFYTVVVFVTLLPCVALLCCCLNSESDPESTSTVAQTVEMRRGYRRIDIGSVPDENCSREVKKHESCLSKIEPRFLFAKP